MLNLLSLTIKNFLSVGNVTSAIHLDKNGLTLVLGDNKDTSNGAGISRNGCGKSVILHAISYALYGSSISNIKKDNLVNNINQKNMLVTLSFERDGVFYRIERGRKPNILRFFINDLEQKLDDSEDSALGENKHTQEEIERIVGMSYTLFRHLVALNTHTDPFLKMRAGDQREVIEELIAISQISSRAGSLKKEITNTEDDIKSIQATLRAKQQSNDHINTAIENLTRQKDAWDLEHEKRIRSLEASLGNYNDIDFDAELKAFDLYDEWSSKSTMVTQEIDTLKKALAFANNELGWLRDKITSSSPNSDAQVSRLENEIARKNRDIDKVSLDIERKVQEFTKLSTDMESADSSICVCCGQSLEGTDHLHTVVENMAKSLATIEADMVSLDNRKTSIEKEIANIQSEIESIRGEDQQRLVEHEQKVQENQAKIAEKQEEIALLEDAIQSCQIDLSELGSAPKTKYSSKNDIFQAKQRFDTIVKDFEAELGKENPNTYQIDTLMATLQEIDYEGLNDAESLLKHQKFLLKLLTSKDSFIRKKIIDQNIHHLNHRMSHYLEKLGLPHQVKFLSDLTVEISLVGRDYDFEQLSRGEQNRVIMATSWAFRDVWEAMNNKINLMMVDELLDQGTDTSGVEAALAILKTMSREGGKSIFLISHKDDLTARINNVLMVRKENDFTTYEEGVS